MNREQTKEAIKVMQAWVDGETIETRHGAWPWNEIDEPSWQWYSCQYRIKPKPREWWIITDPVLLPTVCGNREIAEECARRVGGTVHRVREVLE